MPNYSFVVNGKPVSVNAVEDLPLLWVLRDHLKITGPKYGCGLDVCKACTSFIDGEAKNPCAVKVSAVQGKEVTTIEGLAQGDQLHPVQEAWMEEDVPQCGYCQPGQIMTAVALLKKTKNPTDEQINEIENICRCGTYFRIRRAIKNAAQRMT